MFVHTVLCVVLEPLEYLTMLLMGFSNDHPNYSKWPPLMNLLNFPYSAIIWVLQYLTTLLWGESPRIQIIYARRGYASLHEWQQKEPGEVQYLRAVIDQTICLVYERHQYPLEQ